VKIQKRFVGLIIALAALSLAGLMGVQIYLLRGAMHLREQIFRQNVFAALGGVARKLEMREVAVELWQSADLGNDSMVPAGIGAAVEIPCPPGTEEDAFLIGSPNFRPRVHFRRDSLWFNVKTPQRVSVQFYDDRLGRGIVLIDTIKASGVYALAISDSLLTRELYTIRFTSDSGSFLMRMKNDTLMEFLFEQEITSDKSRVIRTVVDKIARAEWEPLERRVDSLLLDSLVKSELSQAGIEIEPAYGILQKGNDSFLVAKPLAQADNLRGSDLRTRLFPNDILGSRNELVMYFPGRQAYLWSQMGPLVASSGIFAAIIIICFAVAIYTILRQKRLAEKLNDFINNMTHEFKTPISTIALASEALARTEVLEDKDRISRYGRMIADENRRMRSQVEKILQMAVLEEGDFDLKYDQIDVHEAIRKMADNIALLVESRGGELIFEFNAVDPVLEVDPLHFSGIINNLLDNALKYSAESPRIIVRTSEERQGLRIEVEDNGIGIEEKAQTQVFEKYYRVPRGNVHDVKGFGLGLSYVKLMVEAHGGEVMLKSWPGKGTRVSLYLPRAKGGSI